jgi:hypothetical protein
LSKGRGDDSGGDWDGRKLRDHLGSCDEERLAAIDVGGHVEVSVPKILMVLYPGEVNVEARVVVLAVLMARTRDVTFPTFQ